MSAAEAVACPDGSERTRDHPRAAVGRRRPRSSYLLIDSTMAKLLRMAASASWISWSLGSEPEVRCASRLRTFLASSRSLTSSPVTAARAAVAFRPVLGWTWLISDDQSSMSWIRRLSLTASRQTSGGGSAECFVRACPCWGDEALVLVGSRRVAGDVPVRGARAEGRCDPESLGAVSRPGRFVAVLDVAADAVVLTGELRAGDRGCGRSGSLERSSEDPEGVGLSRRPSPCCVR